MRHVMVLIAIAIGSSPASAQPAAAGGATVITLDTALAQARARSPLVDAARERVRAAALGKTIVAPAANPFVEVRGENVGPGAARLPRDVFATISQPIELGGKRAARQAIAGAASEVAAADVSSAEWMLAADVAGTYIAALRAREVKLTLQEQQHGVADLVAILEQRVREGLSAEADLRKFQTEHARLAAAVSRASVTLDAALIRLSMMIGEPVTPERLAVPVLAAPLGAGSREINSRADVLAAQRRVQRAETALALERARGVPDLTVTAGYKRTSGFDTAVAALTMPIGIFDRNRPAIAQAAGELAAARAELRSVTEHAGADAQARWAAALQLADQAARSDADLLTPARIVRAAARAAFAEGRGDVLQLVDAERVYGDAAREALELRLDALHATIQARLASGETPLP